MVDKFKKHLEQNRFFTVGDKILLAVSGGMDSVAMLHLFYRLKNQLQLQFSIVHVHHGIRGAEADEDLEFVRKLAENYQMPFYFRKVDAVKYASINRLSLEEGARELRYQAYAEVLRESGSLKVATAHNANDQAETVLDRLLRGSGISGLCGIPAVRGRYFRPLLIFDRTEIENYVQQLNLSYRQDSSNRDLRFKRNRIRNTLMPYLTANFNPNLVATLCRMGKIFTENERYLRVQSKQAFKSLVLLHKKNEIVLDIVGFLNYFEIIQKYILIEACEALNIKKIALTFDKLESIVTLIKNRNIGKKVAINKQFQLSIDHDGIVINQSKEKPSVLKLNLLKETSCNYQNYELHWKIYKRTSKLQLNQIKNAEVVDFDKAGSRLLLRTLQPGDRFIPLNFTGHKKVSDYFSDQKIPHHLRTEIPILEAPTGIIWICGHCIDDRFKVTSETSKILKLELVEPINAE
ncbi:MAG: tRNA lysidine(34) synthetase TilS [bacterium]